MTWPLKVLYVHSDTPNYVRVSKNIGTFSRMFREVHYVGASRGRPWDRSFDEPNIQYHLWNRALPHGARSLLLLPGFMSFVRRKYLELAPDVVVATNEDAAMPFVLGLIPRPKYLVCDLLDSVAHRVTGPHRFLNPLWQLISSRTLRGVDALVEVTDERLARHERVPPLTTVVMNSPLPARGLEPWNDSFGPSIFLSGSMNDGIAGIETLLRAVQTVPDVTIVAAGRLNGAWLNTTFRTHPRVRFLGEVTPRDSLRIAAKCNAMFAFYKPVNDTMRFAAPNKLFDAMTLGIPLIINEECRASDFAVNEGFGLRCGYDDSRALAELVRRAVSGDERLARDCGRARVVFEEKYAWNHMESRWHEFFARLLGERRILEGT